MGHVHQLSSWHLSSRVRDLHRASFFFFFFFLFFLFLTHVARGKWKKTKRKQNNKQKKEKMSIKPNNLLFLCYLWWSICLIKFAKHQSCLLHLLSCYEAFKWSFSHSCIFQITRDICPQTSKKNRFLLSLSFYFSRSIYLKTKIFMILLMPTIGYKTVSLVFL